MANTVASDFLLTGRGGESRCDWLRGFYPAFQSSRLPTFGCLSSVLAA